MGNALGKQFGLGSLVRFAIPNVVMMIFLSLYTIVDGIFVSRVVGTTALSAINMVYPITSVQMAIGIMLATGGSAIIARRMGEGKPDLARENFTLIVLVSFVIGVLMALACVVFLEQIVTIMGANEAQFAYCMEYGRILFLFAPAFFLMVAFQSLFVTAGKPILGMLTVFAAGITNVVLDYFFIVTLDMGIVGAAWATSLGYLVSAVFGAYYFTFHKKGSLYFKKPSWDSGMLLQTCLNGSSEMVSNLAAAVTTFLYNYQFMKFMGEDGVAAITIVMYFEFVFSAIFFGYSMGVAPVLSYKFGCRDKGQIRKIYVYSMWIMIVCGAAGYVAARASIGTVLQIFTPSGSDVYDLALYGFPIFAVSFLIKGIPIFASGMFTAFSDGITSAIISFARTFLFLAGSILILPLIFEGDGVWWATAVAEALGLIVAAVFLVLRRNDYGYGKKKAS